MTRGDEDSALAVVQNLLDGDDNGGDDNDGDDNDDNDNDNNREDEENDGKMRMAP